MSISENSLSEDVQNVILLYVDSVISSHQYDLHIQFISWKIISNLCRVNPESRHLIGLRASEIIGDNTPLYPLHLTCFGCLLLISLRMKHDIAICAEVICVLCDTLTTLVSHNGKLTNGQIIIDTITNGKVSNGIVSNGKVIISIIIRFLFV